jgi:hypothetical protein
MRSALRTITSARARTRLRGARPNKKTPTPHLARRASCHCSSEVGLSHTVGSTRVATLLLLLFTSMEVAMRRLLAGAAAALPAPTSVEAEADSERRLGRLSYSSSSPAPPAPGGHTSASPSSASGCGPHSELASCCVRLRCR